jgi:DNA-binding beta-propeller fold protein YncE
MVRARAEIFISDAYDGLVNGYNLKTGSLAEQLTGFSLPQGLATDRKGNLFVAATGNSAVYVFAPGATKASLTLHDTGWYPTGVCVSIKGEVAVANRNSLSYGPGNVTFYKPGQTKPFNAVSGATMSTPEFCAYDVRGNLFASGVGSGAGSVVEIVHGGSGTSFKDLGIHNIQIVGGIEIARNGDILVLDQNSGTILRYWRGHHKLIGTTFLQSGGDSVTFALTPPSENFVYAADFGLQGAEKYPFPSGGPPIRSIPTSNAIGVALSPWARP